MPATSPVTTSAPTEPAWFESMYRSAAGQFAQLPWPTGSPCGAMVNWLNAVAPAAVRCGARVCVIGCGLGDDARELLRRGYEVTAFDCCSTAVQEARQQDAANASSYVQADILHPPARWRHRFDLVVEVNNLCWWTPDMRLAAISAAADLLAMHGRLLVISPACEFSADADEPPWPLTEVELLEATALAGLVPAEPISVFSSDDSTSQLQLRGTFRRA